MLRLEDAVALRDGLDRHPAARAWRQLRPQGVPTEIRILKERSKGISKSAVYWLADADARGRAVIAKLSRRTAVEVEALVYREFLGRLSVAAPAYRGMVDDGGPFCWLFMEHVPGEPYSPAHPHHRRLAGAWVGRLHREGASLQRADRLPDLGTGHHLVTLRHARRAMAAHRGDPSLTRAEAMTLQRVIAVVDDVHGSWPHLEAVCSELPPTLVHGDLVRKNLRVAPAATGAAMVAFDWEQAGWGPSAIDLAQSLESTRFTANACLASYRSACAPGETPTHEQVERQAIAGTVLRCLAAIHWTSQSLGPPWHQEADGGRCGFLEKRAKTLVHLEVYAAWLERSLRALRARVAA
jgi:Ser/Thr protein kinase RdoA (MazF antagonist)